MISQILPQCDHVFDENCTICLSNNFIATQTWDDIKETIDEMNFDRD